MLNVRAQISILITLSVLLTACGNSGGKKVKINKSNRNKGVSEWVQDVVYKETTTTPGSTAPGRQGRAGTTTPATTNVNVICLSIPLLVDAMSANKNGTSEQDKKEMISIGVFDLDFVRPADERPRANVVRMTFASEGIDNPALQIQKANYFFQTRKADKLADMVPASGLKTSALGLKLLNVASQAACSTVVFHELGAEGRPQQVTYDMVEASNRRVVLRRQATGNQIPGEYRIYQLDGRSFVRVSVVKEVAGIPICTGAAQPSHFVKEEFLFARSRDLDRSQISRNLGVMFNSFVLSTPEIEEPLKRTVQRERAAPATNANGRGNRNQPRFVTSNQRFSISGATFGFMINRIYEGNAGKNDACTAR